jgi:hypothetical protein
MDVGLVYNSSESSSADAKELCRTHVWANGELAPFDEGVTDVENDLGVHDM